MRKHMKSLFMTLLAIAVVVIAQTPPSAFSPYSRSINFGIPLVEQVQPACFDVHYDIKPNFQACSSTTNQVTVENIVVQYTPTTTSDANAASQDVSISLWGVDAQGKAHAIPVSHLLGSQSDFSTACAVAEDGSTVVRSPTDLGVGCGIAYYCSEFCSTNNFGAFFVKVSTASDEQVGGISYSLSVDNYSLFVRPLRFNTTATFIDQPSNTVTDDLFLPAQYQSHYFVDVAPVSASLLNNAAYQAQKVDYSQLVFTLSNLLVNGLPVTDIEDSVCPEIGLYINYQDIAVSPRLPGDGRVDAEPEDSCNIDSARQIICTGDSISIAFGSCSISTGRFFVSVGLPTDAGQTYSYSLGVGFKAIEEQALPTYKVLTASSNTFTSELGTDVDTLEGVDPVQEAYFLLNFDNPSGNSDLFVYVYGVNGGTFQATITRNQLGFLASCEDDEPLYSCSEPDGEEDRVDFCKIKIPSCEFKPNATSPYWLNVRTTVADENNVVEFTVFAETKAINTKNVVKSLKATSDAISTTYSEATSVSEQEYKHYQFNLDLNSLSTLSMLKVTVYTNQEQNEIQAFYNPGSLAGGTNILPYSDLAIFDGPNDECFESVWTCNTARRESVGLDLDSYVGNGECTLYLPYCVLARNANHFFSVYGINSSPQAGYYDAFYPGEIDGNLGYNRSVDYTVKFQLYNDAETLVPNVPVNGIVNVPEYGYSLNQDFFYSFGSYRYYSHQYRVTVPADVEQNEFYDQIRVQITAVQGFKSLNESLTISIACGQAAGQCPCYDRDTQCVLAASDTSRLCVVALPICKCPERVYYVSVSTNYDFDVDTPFEVKVNEPVFYTITAKLFRTELRDEIFALPAVINDSQLPTLDAETNFYDISYINASRSGRIYNTHLYRYNFVPNPNKLQQLVATVRFSRKPNSDPLQAVILAISKDVVSPVSLFPNQFDGNCALECIAAPLEKNLQDGFSFCTIVVDPCEFSEGEYFFRVSAATEGTTVIGVDYTLEVDVVELTQQTLTVPQSFISSLGLERYDFFEVDLSLLDVDQAFEVSVYQDSNHPNDLIVYFSTDSFAGARTDCFEHFYSCDINIHSSACKVNFGPCFLRSNDKIYISVKVPSSGPVDPLLFAETAFGSYSTLFGEAKVPYTISVSQKPVVNLDDGHPRTAYLRYGEDVARFSFNIPSNAANILHVELKSLEPNLPNADSARLSTFISKGKTLSSVPQCGCGEILFTDEFETTNFPCELQDKAGTYYLTIFPLRNGANPFDPVSFTVRVWWTTVQQSTLTVGQNPIAVPSPLNYDQWINYRILSTDVNSSVQKALHVEISDLYNSLNVKGNEGIEAFLSSGTTMASPEHTDSLFSFGVASSCAQRSCALANTEVSNANLLANPGTVMCNFELTHCDGVCGSEYRLTVHSKFTQPQPVLSERANFTVRAFNSDINVPNQFPLSSGIRELALAPGGFTFTFNETSSAPVASLSNSFGATVRKDYFFRLPTINLNSLEDLTITPVNFPSGLVLSLSPDASPTLSGDDSCRTFTEVDSCDENNVPAAYTVYGVIGFSSLDGSEQLSTLINGLQINVNINNDKVYTENVPEVTLVPGRYSNDLVPGQYRIHRFAWDRSNFDLFPLVTIATGSDSGRIDFCFSEVDPDLQFPCSACGFTGITLETCCANDNTEAYIIAYNDKSNAGSFSYTIDLTEVIQTRQYTPLSLPSSSTTGRIGNGNQYDMYSFELTPQNFQADSILNFRFTPVSGDRQTVFLNFASWAGSSSTGCFDNFYTCVAGTDECFAQLPFCFFGNRYGTYYFAIQGPTSAANQGTLFSIFVEDPVDLDVGVPAASTVPDANQAPIDTLSHFRFKYDRVIGELGPSSTNARLSITLETTSVTNSLRLFIQDSRLSTTQNVLAGPTDAFSGVLPPTCRFGNDLSDWTCSATATNPSGGAIVCTASLCGNADSFLKQNADEYIYVSVQNVEINDALRVATNFRVTFDVVSDFVPSSEALFTITPTLNFNDDINSVECNTQITGNGGCRFTQSAFSTATSVIFEIDTSDVSSWGPVDYLQVNITDITSGSSISVVSWTSDECQPSSAGVSCTGNCIFANDPCQQKAFVFADGQGSADAQVRRNSYFQIITNGASFNFEARRVSPQTNVITLTNASPSFSGEYESWSGRYSFFNFRLPQTGTWSFDVEVDSPGCSNDAPQVFANPHSFLWATPVCSQVSSDGLPFVGHLDSCENLGNYFVTVFIPENSLADSDVLAAEGRLSLKTRFTIKASISLVSSPLIAWNCETPITKTVSNYRLVGGADIGSKIKFALTDCSSDCSLKVITPIYSQRASNFETDFVTYIGASEDSVCVEPSCDENGVYCCEVADDETGCEFQISDCNYRSDLFHVIVRIDEDEEATLSTEFFKSDIKSITLNSDNNNLFADVIYVSESINFPENGQIFKVTSDLNLSNLLVQVIPDEVYVNNHDCDFGTCTVISSYPDAIITLRVWSGEQGLDYTADQCDIDEIFGSLVQCSIGQNSSCVITSQTCAADSYYVSISVDQGFDIPVFVVFTTDDFIDYGAPTPLVPGVARCYDFKGIDNIFGGANFDDVVLGPGDYYLEDGEAQGTKLINYDTVNNIFVSRVFYQLDTTNLDLRYGRIEVVVDISPASLADSTLDVSYNIGEVASAFCADCTKEFSFGNKEPLVIECGLSGPIFIIVEAQRETELVEFIIKATFIARPRATLASPRLSGHNQQIVTSSITKDTVVVLDNSVGHAITSLSVVGGSILKVSGPEVADCENGCADINACVLADTVTYGIFAQVDVPSCSTVKTSATISATIQNIVSITPGAVTSDTICANGDLDYHLYVIDTATISANNFGGFVFSVTSLDSGDIDVAFGCDFVPTCNAPNATLSTSEGDFSYSLGGCPFECRRVYIAVRQNVESCGLESDVCTDYAFRLDVQLRDSTPNAPVVVPAWTGVAESVYALSEDSLYYDSVITAGTDGFVHVAIGNVNGTVSSAAQLVLYKGIAPSSLDLDDDCIVARCSTGDDLFLDDNFDGNNNDAQSCFVYSTASAGALYTARVVPAGSLLGESAGLLFRVQGFANYTQLNGNGAVQSTQIQGSNRHYYRFSSLVSRSVSAWTLKVAVSSGPRILVEVADSPAYRTADAGSYPGWSQSLICQWGECRIEIATRAQHPVTSTFYVWVSTLPYGSTGSDEGAVLDAPIEQATNYNISVVVGAGNCRAPSALSLTYCKNNLDASSLYWATRDSSLLDKQASCLVGDVSCFCPAPLPSSPCAAALQRFACLEVFRECDTNGFFAPICRDECEKISSSCGDFSEDSCDGRTELTCLSTRYSSSEPCTGQVATPVPVPSPSASPAAQDSTLEAPSVYYYEEELPSPTPSPVPSPTTTPSVSLVGSASSLSFSVLVLVASTLFALLF
eukprot:TRINITY_DN349_c0_g1_i3.p1 TRINITY_DN349_c0_g1~~TRINITY_DN349_c0_g1_i3.p1  ORF type:complete len:3408 (-),score=1699.08 TRINITY_DN349_c0_g1_i3:220-10443(-)